MFHHRSYGTADLVALLAAHRAVGQRETQPSRAEAQAMTEELARLRDLLLMERRLVLPRRQGAPSR